MSKRQRPCDFCRSRKTACRIDQAPPCRLCVLHGRECTFIEAAAPRKRPLPSEGGRDSAVHSPPSYRPSPQIAAATPPSPPQVPTSLSGNQLSDEAGIDFVGELNFDTTQSEFEAMFRTPRAPSTPSAVWTRNLPQQLGRAEDAEYPAGANPQLMGLSGDMDPLLLQHYRFDENGIFGFKELAIHSVQDSPLPCHFLVSQQSLFTRRRDEAGLEKPNQDLLMQELEKAIPTGVGERLIKLFWDFIHPQWPIFSTMKPPDTTSTPAYLLASIYAISLPFAVYDDKLSVDVAYDKPPYPAISRIIDKALSYEIHSPSIAVAQTLLLLVLRPSSDPLVADTAYRRDVLGRLVSCATTLGLHLEPSDWSMLGWHKAQRRRLSFFIYAADKWIACSHGTSPFTHQDDWLVTGLEAKDFAGSGLQSDDETRLIGFSARTAIISSALSSL